MSTLPTPQLGYGTFTFTYVIMSAVRYGLIIISLTQTDKQSKTDIPSVCLSVCI